MLRDVLEVKAPKPGTEAWSQAGPTGSRTNCVTVTPEGDLIEVGQTEAGGVPQPMIRKRSGGPALRQACGRRLRRYAVSRRWSSSARSRWAKAT